ncbi:hypothetical protein OESDEN_15230 [Oesophagostomum dentatum]|uniref:Uncharacterized protein n=1 Tax=Oesophagostomum dentatum TaxID=61180 RepID=A0A0B1SJF6_OESDE|nr:hypothetical protein OESDEN_15230 [Oesophagostomum dentatum]
MLIVCKHKKNKIYRPGHIPELFPDREKGRINRVSLLEEEKPRTGACTPASEGVVLSDTQPTKDKLPSVK